MITPNRTHAHRPLATTVCAAVVALASALSALAVVPSAGAASTSSSNGGALTFGEVAGITSLDPIHIAGGGTSGGSEAGAVYGYLMRYDTTTGTYVPYLAQGLTHNADFTQWTLKLRPNMTFSDGTPFDAHAVVENFQRDMDPAKHATAGGILHLIQVDQRPGRHHCRLHPDRAVVGLPLRAGLHAREPIAAPSYIAQVDAGNANATAIGAGPFKVASFQPAGTLTLTPNPTYVLAKPKLKPLKFVVHSRWPGHPAGLPVGPVPVGPAHRCPLGAQAETTEINVVGDHSSTWARSS